MRNIIIHIGLPRTGTSTFQAGMWANRARLKELGFDYPNVAKIHPTKGDAQHNLAFTLLEKYPGWVGEKGRQTFSEAWEEFNDYIDACEDGDNSTIVLSSEAFSSLDEKAIRTVRALLEEHNVRIVMVRRKPLEWHKSMWRQQIRNYPFRTEMPPELDKVVNDHSQAVMVTWSKYFPITVLEYSRNIIQDLLLVIGLAGKINFDDIANQNVRIDDQAYKLMTELNKIDTDGPQKLQINRAIEKWYKKGLVQ